MVTRREEKPADLAQTQIPSNGTQNTCTGATPPSVQHSGLKMLCELRVLHLWTA